MDIARLGTNAFMSEVVTSNGLVWVAGMVGMATAEQSVAAQTRDILAQLDERLASVGSDRSLMTSANIWLADIADWQEVNDIWIVWLNGAPAPARATVQAGLVPPFKVEIAATAVLRQE